MTPQQRSKLCKRVTGNTNLNSKAPKEIAFSYPFTFILCFTVSLNLGWWIECCQIERKAISLPITMDTQHHVSKANAHTCSRCQARENACAQVTISFDFASDWSRIGLLQLAITWYKICHAGRQAHYYSRTGTLKQRDLNRWSLTCLCFDVPVRE